MCTMWVILFGGIEGGHGGFVMVEFDISTAFFIAVLIFKTLDVFLCL